MWILCRHFIMFILSRWARIGVHVYCRTNRCVPSEWLLSLAGRLLHHLLMDLNNGKLLGTLECSLVLERHLLEIVFNASQSFVKRSIALATKYHSVKYKIWNVRPTLNKYPTFGSGRVGVLKYMIGYFWVSFLLSCISGYLFNLGYFWVFQGKLDIICFFEEVSPILRFLF